MKVKEDSSVICEPHPDVRNSGTVQLYGWDARTSTGNGPHEFPLTLGSSHRLLDVLRSTPGRSWFGPVNCPSSDTPGGRFFTVVHNMPDCGVAMLYCDESKAGPVEVVVVIPPERRAHMRAEFAFEFVAFAGFLGCIGSGDTLSIHDWITAAIVETDPSDPLVLSISTGIWTADQDHVLSRCVEKIAVTMLLWLREP